MKAVSITLEPELLEAVDVRVGILDTDRSKYFRNLARKEMENGLLGPVNSRLPRSARLAGRRAHKSTKGTK
jgi:hypothetical protein